MDLPVPQELLPILPPGDIEIDFDNIDGCELGIDYFKIN